MNTNIQNDCINIWCTLHLVHITISGRNRTGSQKCSLVYMTENKSSVSLKNCSVCFAYATVFNSKFHSVFERKPTQLPPLAMHVSGDLQAVGFKKNDVITSAIPSTPPWLLIRDYYSRSNSVQFVSSATVPYFLPLVKYQLSYTRIHACGRKLHTSDR